MDKKKLLIISLVIAVFVAAVLSFVLSPKEVDSNVAYDQNTGYYWCDDTNYQCHDSGGANGQDYCGEDGAALTHWDLYCTNGASGQNTNCFSKTDTCVSGICDDQKGCAACEVNIGGDGGGSIPLYPGDGGDAGSYDVMYTDDLTSGEWTDIGDVSCDAGGSSVDAPEGDQGFFVLVPQ